MESKSKIEGLEFEYSELEITEQEGSVGGKWYPGKYIGKGLGELFGGGRSAPSQPINLPSGGGCFPQPGGFSQRGLLFSRMFNSLFGGFF